MPKGYGQAFLFLRQFVCPSCLMLISGFSRKKEKVSSSNLVILELLQNCVLNVTDGCKKKSWTQLNHYHVISSLVADFFFYVFDFLIFFLLCYYGDDKELSKKEKKKSAFEAVCGFVIHKISENRKTLQIGFDRVSSDFVCKSENIQTKVMITKSPLI